MRRPLLAIAFVLSPPLTARAETIQVPFGAKAAALGDARIACGAPGGGWIVEAGGHSVRPPIAEETIGRSVELKLATEPAGCATSHAVVTLVVTGRWPVIDPASVIFSPDEGRVDARGSRLKGLGVTWKTSAGSSIDSCQDPKLEPNAERCNWAVGHGLSADPTSNTLAWVPAGGRAGADVSTYDLEGKRALPDTFALTPARILLTALMPPDSAIDLSTGRGEVPLLHPEAINSVDCGAVRCEIAEGKLQVKGLSSVLNAVDVKFRLAPHVFLQKKDISDPQPAARLAVLHCPMSIASGPPLRGVDSARAVIRIEGRCSRDVAALRFLVGNSSVDALQTEADDDGADVVLRLGNIDAPAVSITAVRADDPTVTVAVARADTQATPPVRATLELPGYPNMNFIPNNRGVIVHLPKLEDHAKLIALPIDGVYSVRRGEDGSTVIQGDPNAGGLTALRFGYRMESLPGHLAQVDLAVLVDPLQRSIHEANLPAPIGPSALSPEPLVELVCSDGKGGLLRVVPGDTAHLPFDARDTCRLVFHRERLAAEYGTQKLNLDIEVLNADGNARGEAHVAQTVVLRSGEEAKYAWINGVKAPFDRVIVRLTQAADEAHYIGALDIPTGAPDVKWTMVLGTGHARLYATSAIPTGLYRFGDAGHSGVLSLNFGIVSRLTWLDRDGHEGFLGLEAGIMAIGLTDDKGATGQSLTQIGAIAGLGISVPIANRSSPTEAAINLHAWVEEDISHREASGSRFAVIFGPSISIGNVGTNL